jgi:GT2 family glycosyltransferase
MGIEKIILVGVNYGSSAFVDQFVASWLSVPEVRHIVVVDNFSDDAEVRRIQSIVSRDDRISALFRKNDGYGAALNDGVQHVLSSVDCRNSLVLFGNVDVTPVSVSLSGIDSGAIPEISIIQDSRVCRVFLTRFQRHFLGLMRIAVATGSSFTLLMYVMFNRLLGLIPSKTWAVHGALFALTADQLARVHPVFDGRAFLYCEELFFARRIETLGVPYRPAPITVKHIGSVSTGKTVKASAQRLFATWRQSARVFLETAR